VSQAGELPDYLYIDGQRVRDATLDTIETHDPASGLWLASVPAGSRQSIDAAVAAAKRALHGPWADFSPRDRSRLMWQAGEAIRAQIDRLALLQLENRIEFAVPQQGTRCVLCDAGGGEVLEAAARCLNLWVIPIS
jgi:acyl-CoA reductase-like NAD-dependent aldehyde dehydrogenase